MFNTLKYVKIMSEAGFSQKQAETSIEVLYEVMEESLATKHDLEMQRSATKHDLQLLKSELIIKLGAMQAASVALMVTLIKLL